MRPARTWDIFCTVVDNYGDIGVCWRLARQLVAEHGQQVRLWVDDLASFCRLCPEIDPLLAQQFCRGVEVRHWTQPFPATDPADVVVEAFACELPPDYLAAMAVALPSASDSLPSPLPSSNGRGGIGRVWINLEYLTAEPWAAACHKMPSPHPSLPLIKYFFFPGFTQGSGGLLREQSLISQRDALQQKPETFWAELGLTHPLPNPLEKQLSSRLSKQACKSLLTPLAGEGADAGDPRPVCTFPSHLEKQLSSRQSEQTCKSLLTPHVGEGDDASACDAGAFETTVSLFCYDSAPIGELLEAWATSPTPLRCLLPEGKAVAQVAAWFGKSAVAPGDILQRGNLTVQILPFLEQDDYDRLLWACDCNFVRGEDSFVRAQWAGKPMAWQIYPQNDEAHLAKLQAFLDLYCAKLPADAATALRTFWLAWNNNRLEAQHWIDFWRYRQVLQAHAESWTAEIVKLGSLSFNLAQFVQD